MFYFEQQLECLNLLCKVENKAQFFCIRSGILPFVKLFISIVSLSMFNVIFRCTYFCRILLTQTRSSMTKTCKNLTLHHLKVCCLSVFCCWTHRNQTKLFVELAFSNVTILQYYKGRGHIKHLKGNSRGIHFKILKLQLLKVIS